MLPSLKPLQSKEGCSHWYPQHVHTVHSLRKCRSTYGPFLDKPCSPEHLQPGLTCVMKKVATSSSAELGGGLGSSSPSPSAVCRSPAGVTELTGGSGWAGLGSAASLTASTAAGSCFHRKALTGASSISGCFVTLGRCDVTWADTEDMRARCHECQHGVGSGSWRLVLMAPGTPWQQLQSHRILLAKVNGQG